MLTRKGEYYGSEEKRLAINGLLISEYSYFADAVDWHYHENPYFMYVLDGQLLDINKKRSLNCTPGTLLLNNWQDPHRNSRHSKESRGFHVEFDREWLKSHHFDEVLWEGSRTFSNPEIHRIIFNIYKEFKQGDKYSTMSLEALTLSLSLAVNDTFTSFTLEEPSWVPQLKDLLNNGEPFESLTTLAAIIGIHPVHLSAAFPKYFGHTIGGYMRKLNVQKSMVQLLQPNKSLSEIACENGFSDQSHYTRCFKECFNTTPHKFRKVVFK